MPSRPYTRLLGSVSGAGTDSLELFTAPAGYVTILRDILFNNADSVTVTLNFYRTAGEGTRRLMYQPVAGTTTLHVELRQVIPPGCTVFCNAGGAGWSMSLTGYQLLDEF